MKYSGIGGQAVIEGIMMMNRNDYAVAVRKPDQEIEVKRDLYISITQKVKLFSLPFVRGVFRFADSMIVGNFVGEDALAAVGASYALTNVFICIAIGGGVLQAILEYTGVLNAATGKNTLGV